MASFSALRPFLKWAGGKRQLLPVLRGFYPGRFDRYWEPFLGSAAVFFDLRARGLLDGRAAVLADTNPDLIACYSAVRDEPEDVIHELGVLAAAHAASGAEHYYDVRDKRFNPARRRAAGYTPALAAMFIYLNRTGYNGLFRLNRDGAFNVPAGRYANPRICDPDHVRSVAAAFAERGVTIECTPFEEMLADAGAGDFVYCDPPYAPLSRTASFAHYTAGGFSAFDQRRLQQAVIAACRRGAKVLLSNSSAPEIVELYSAPAARKAGLRLTLVPARRAINSRASGRGPVHEVVVTNVRPQPALAIPGKLRMARASARAARVQTA